MMRIKIYMLFSLLALGFSDFGNAQEKRDSLQSYLEIASKNNPTVQQRFQEYMAAVQKVPQVGSLQDPELNAGVFLSPMAQIDGNQIADFRLMQMFPWFGTLKAAKDEMSLMAKAKYELFSDAKFQVFYDVQQTWFELYKIQQAIQISEKNLEILHTLERLSLVKFKAVPLSGINKPSNNFALQNNAVQITASNTQAMQQMGGNSNPKPMQSAGAMQDKTMNSAGVSGLADLYRIQMELGELQNEIALLKNKKNTVVAQFNSLLNKPSDTFVSIPDTLNSNALNLSILAIGDSILVKNPMLAMLNFEKKSLDAREQMVTKMGYPMIGLGLNYSVFNKSAISTSAMNGNDMVMPMVTITLPIYRKKYKAMQKEVENLKLARTQEIQATSNSLKTEYYEAVQDYEDAQRRVALYIRQYQLANQSLKILIKSFSASQAGLTDLLIIQQQTLNYELKQVEAVADFNSAIAKLQRLMAYSQIQ